ncbi:MAG TPA: hypothetical protein VMX75_08415, partial [Spirochaetia bacterium]|nr:hypothetical protein [Spirochaetia bacterium]
SFLEITKAASSWYSSFKHFDSPPYREKMRSRLAEEKRVLLLAVYSSKNGLQYLFSRNQRYTASPESMEENWQQKPVYLNLPLGSRLFTLPFADTSEGILSIDGLCVVLGTEDFFPIIKETFIILFIFFVATCIVILLVPSSPTGSEHVTEYQGPKESEPVKKTDSRNLFSPETGLGWSDHLPQRLKFEIDRAASLDQDLVLALISVDQYGTLKNREAVYSKIAKMILDEFPFQDLAFEYRKAAYALIIPDADLDQGSRSLDQFRKRAVASPILDQRVSISIGLSSRNGRLVNGATLISESSEALKKALVGGENSLLAFRANPDQYRDYVAKKLS